jgi:type IV pilus assembly protein PilX
MTHLHRSRRLARPVHRSAQQGVVMLFGLIALAIMLIGAAAMVHSMNTAMVNAGNLGFKRDLTNQAERGVATVLTLMQSGALGSDTARQSSSTALNYSASMLPSNAQGLPDALVADSSFSTAGLSSNDIVVSGQAVTVRYLIDRLCANVGVASADHCAMADDPNPVGGSGSETIRAEDASAGGAGAIGRRVVYRVSIRVDGPRNTQAFYQTTLTL